MTRDDTIFLIDDDESVLRSLKRFFAGEGYRVETFANPRLLLAEPDIERAACMVVDMRMPAMSGLELQEALSRRGCLLPAVFITGHADVPASVRAMKGGAIDVLLKPYDEDELLAAAARAIERGRGERSRRDERAGAGARWRTLTSREMEVARLVTSGMLNKQIAAVLGTAEKTVTVHRARAMQKLELESVADLVRLLDLLDKHGDGALPD